VKADHEDFEIVFISSDRNQEAFDGYYAEMPWVALPYSLRDAKSELSDKFEVQGIPTLTLLDKNGEVLHKNGRSQVAEYGAKAFPFSEARVEALKAEQEQQKKVLEEKLAADGLLKTLFGDKAPALKENPTEVLVVFQADGSPGTSVHVLPRLRKAYAELNKEAVRMTCVVIGHDDFKDPIEDNWTLVSGDAVDAAALERINTLLGKDGAPMISVFSADGKKLLGGNRTMFFYNTQAAGFPWTKEVEEKREREKKEASEKIKNSLKNLGCLEGAKLLGQEGKEADLATVADADVVGLYFSAHWCPRSLRATTRWSTPTSGSRLCSSAQTKMKKPSTDISRKCLGSRSRIQRYLLLFVLLRLLSCGFVVRVVIM
jgi:nucleoredoxin